jgi:hypothetical protein
MEPYKSYAYLYPPRPEYKINPTTISTYDNGEYLAQPKYNGSCCVVFMNETELHVMNRHKQKMTLVHFDKIDFRSAYKGSGWMVLTGELLNKNQIGETGESFNQKLIIWDILVYNGQYLIDTTIETRLELLTKLYPEMGGSHFKHLIPIGLKGIYRAPVYENKFDVLYQSIVSIPLYEGLVFKRKGVKLSYGYNSGNNSGWNVKCRKETKNYQF